MREIEALGFVLLRHKTLLRSHALAFATAPLPSDALATGLLGAAPTAAPELRMRREDLRELQRRDGLLAEARIDEGGMPSNQQGSGADAEDDYDQYETDEAGLFRL